MTHTHFERRKIVRVVNVCPGSQYYPTAMLGSGILKTLLKSTSDLK